MVCATTYAKVEVAVAVAIGVLKPKAVPPHSWKLGLYMLQNLWNPRRGFIGQVQSKTNVLDGADKTIHCLQWTRQDSSQNCVTIQITLLMHTIGTRYNT